MITVSRPCGFSKCFFLPFNLVIWISSSTCSLCHLQKTSWVSTSPKRDVAISTIHSPRKSTLLSSTFGTFVYGWTYDKSRFVPSNSCFNSSTDIVGSFLFLYNKKFWTTCGLKILCTSVTPWQPTWATLHKCSIWLDTCSSMNRKVFDLLLDDFTNRSMKRWHFIWS